MANTDESDVDQDQENQDEEEEEPKSDEHIKALVEVLQHSTSSNYVWRCLIADCTFKGHGTSRIKVHMQQDHIHLPQVARAVKLYKGRVMRRKTATAGEGEEGGDTAAAATPSSSSKTTTKKKKAASASSSTSKRHKAPASAASPPPPPPPPFSAPSASAAAAASSSPLDAAWRELALLCVTANLPPTSFISNPHLARALTLLPSGAYKAQLPSPADFTQRFVHDRVLVPETARLMALHLPYAQETGCTLTTTLVNGGGEEWLHTSAGLVLLRLAGEEEDAEEDAEHHPCRELVRRVTARVQGGASTSASTLTCQVWAINHTIAQLFLEDSSNSSNPVHELYHHASRAVLLPDWPTEDLWALSAVLSSALRSHTSSDVDDDDASFWQLARECRDALLPLGRFAQEMLTNRLNISLVHVGWLGCAASASASSASVWLLPVLRESYAQFCSPTHLAAHMLTPWLVDAVFKQLRQTDRALFLAMRQHTLDSCLAVLEQFPMHGELHGDVAHDVLETSLTYYLAKAGPFAQVQYDQASAAPRFFYEQQCPCPVLAHCAQRILCIVPVAVSGGGGASAAAPEAGEPLWARVREWLQWEARELARITNKTTTTTISRDLSKHRAVRFQAMVGGGGQEESAWTEEEESAIVKSLASSSSSKPTTTTVAAAAVTSTPRQRLQVVPQVFG